MLIREDILGVILAGGQGRRMGFVDKPLIEIGGEIGVNGAVLDHISDRLKPQVTRMIINANAAQDVYRRYCDDVVADSVNGFLGPLAGILTALDWAAMNTGFSHIMTLPGDAPFIPRDLVAKMVTAYNEMPDDSERLVRATSNGRTHPVIGLWPVSIRAGLRDNLINKDIRKIDRFTEAYQIKDVDFEGVPDPFFNINTDDDVANASRIIAGMKSKRGH